MLFVRPSIGWLSYFIIRQSPGRLGLVLLVGALLTLVCVWESQFTLTLTFQAPGPYPPPVMILTAPNSGPLTVWDACGIEAATRPVKVDLKERTEHPRKSKIPNSEEVKKLAKELLNPMKIQSNFNSTHKGFHPKDLEDLHEILDRHDKMADDFYEKLVNLPHGSIPSDELQGSEDVEEGPEFEEGPDNVTMEYGKENDGPRDVWVYLWRPTVFKGDGWTHFVSKLPGVHLNYFDPKKGVPSTQLRSWGHREGLLTQQTWVAWVTAALSLLWGSGGIVLPAGVILTRPLAVTPMGEGMGVLLENGVGENISPLVVGAPPQHGVLEAAFKMLAQNDKLTSTLPPDPSLSPHSYLTPITPLLSEAVQGGCDTEGVPSLGSCDNFVLLPHGEAVAVGDVQEVAALRTLLLPPPRLLDAPLVSAAFRALNLRGFCPRVAGETLGPGIPDL